MLVAMGLLGFAAAAVARRGSPWAERATIVGTGLMTMLAWLAAWQVVADGPLTEAYGALRLDGFGAWILALIAPLGLSSAIYGIGYLARTREEAHRFWPLFNLFLAAMVIVPMAASPYLAWAALAGTTLASAPLVAFHHGTRQVEAAWKYFLLASAGALIGLLGTVVFGGLGVSRWDAPIQLGNHPAGLVQFAFILVLIGYGTKAGLAPMHVWLPDAHSEAPAPVSALLSGVELDCALYLVVRYERISGHLLGAWPAQMLLAVALLSLAVAATFVLVQRDGKRLLAYSSVEQMGLVAAGFAFGGPWGIVGGLWQMLGHALSKSLLFYGMGQVLLLTGRKSLDEVRGLMRRSSALGWVLLLGALAASGLPPFSTFLSEVYVVGSGFTASQPWAASFILLCLLVVFIGLVRSFHNIVYLPEPRLEGAALAHEATPMLPVWAMPLLTLHVLLLVVLGLYMPAAVRALLQAAAGTM